MATITIPYLPRNWAQELHSTIVRWIVLVIHRRAGKTTAILNHLQRDSLRISNSRFAYVGPTYKQSKRIAWDIAKDIARVIPGVKFNESELTVLYPNGSKLFLLGSDNPDSLRGLGLWGVGLDEWPQQPPVVFSEIISKCLADHLGYCIWAGTPKGKGDFFRLYKQAKNPANKDWLLIYGTIDDTLAGESGKTIENLQQALADDRRLVETGIITQDEFDQEWYCSFEAAIRGAYYSKQIAKARAENRIKRVPHDPALKVHTVWDLGMNDTMCIGFYQKAPGELRKIDYYESSEKGLAHYASILQQRQKDKSYVYGKHFAPHDIKFREMGTGVSRLETAEKLGIKFEVVKNIPVQDGIDAARNLWNRLWVDEGNCELWLDAVSQYRKKWNEKTQSFEDKPYHDWASHAADEFRYTAIVEQDMTNEKEKPYKQKPYEAQSEFEGGEAPASNRPVTEQELGQM